jgi:hypothetical protein
MRQSRRSYYRLAHLLRTMTVVPALELGEVRKFVLARFTQVSEARESDAGYAGISPAA